MSEITPKIGLKIPAAGSFTQASDIQDSFRNLDALVGQLVDENTISGTATGGSATTLTDTNLTLGTNAFAGGVLVVFRNGVLLRAEQVTSNTVDTLTIPTGTAIVAGDTYTLSAMANAIPAGEKGTANGVATTDTNNELVQSPAGAAAEVAASRPSSVKRSDGVWEELRTRHGRMGASSSVSVSSSASIFTRLNLDGVVYNDTDNFFSGANSIILPAGTWLVSVSFKVNFAVNASGIRRVMVYWGGAALTNSSLVDQLANSSTGTNIACDLQNVVVAGDGIKALDIRVAQNSGSALVAACTYATIKIERIIT